MLILKGSDGYLCQLTKSVMTARFIELGSRASYTLRARSPPQHRSLGNVPDNLTLESDKLGPNLEDIIDIATRYRGNINCNKVYLKGTRSEIINWIK
jgi:hypothetical protein